MTDYSNIRHLTADGLIAKESFTRTMCTATNSAIPTAPVREEWHTRLTTPRRVGAGGSRGVRAVACAACQAAARPAPSTRGRTGSSTGTSCTATHSAIPTVPMREEWQTRLTKPLHVGAGGPAGFEQACAPPARRRRALHPVPEVARVPLCRRRPLGEPTPRRLRRTRGQRTDA